MCECVKISISTDGEADQPKILATPSSFLLLARVRKPTGGTKANKVALVDNQRHPQKSPIVISPWVHAQCPVCPGMPRWGGGVAGWETEKAKVAK